MLPRIATKIGAEFTSSAWMFVKEDEIVGSDAMRFRAG